jgi:hypothetical protein
LGDPYDESDIDEGEDQRSVSDDQANVDAEKVLMIGTVA